MVGLCCMFHCLHFHNSRVMGTGTLVHSLGSMNLSPMIVAYSRLMNFYISHIPSEESTRLLVAFAKALISEDLESVP